MALIKPQDTARKRILELLASAQAHIRADRLDDAAAIYRSSLEDRALAQHSDAHFEVLSNYGALLLHAFKLADTNPGQLNEIDLAIDLLCQARQLGRAPSDESGGPVADANLALAYFERYRHAKRPADLMSAHLILGDVESALGDSDRDLRDWVRSIRETLLSYTGHRHRVG